MNYHIVLECFLGTLHCWRQQTDDTFSDPMPRRASRAVQTPWRSYAKSSSPNRSLCPIGSLHINSVERGCSSGIAGVCCDYSLLIPDSASCGVTP